MRDDIIQLLNKIIDSPDIPGSTKDAVVRHFMLPKADSTGAQVLKAPIEKTEDPGRVGAVHRPSKADLDLRNNPEAKAEQEEMTETLDGLGIQKNE